MDSQQQNTAGAVHQIPNDLIYSIMLKLPTKSLVRFLTLSKEWKKEITSRKFFNRRKKTSPELLVSNILVGHSDYQKKLFKVDAHRIWGSHCQHGGCTMELSSCPVRSWLFSSTSDGLLGIVYEKDDVDQVKLRIYLFVIWNPYTGQKKKILLPPPKGRYNYENGACSVVFGYDSTIDDYKIVVIFLDNNSISLNNFGEVVGIMIGALRSDDQWRIVYCASSNSSDLERFSKHDAIAIDGDVWWIAKRVLGKSQSSCFNEVVFIRREVVNSVMATRSGRILLDGIFFKVSRRVTLSDCQRGELSIRHMEIYKTREYNWLGASTCYSKAILVLKSIWIY